jgi:hypothetical protein
MTITAMSLIVLKLNLYAKQPHLRTWFVDQKGSNSAAALGVTKIAAFTTMTLFIPYRPT